MRPSLPPGQSLDKEEGMSGFWLVSIVLGAGAYELHKRGKRRGAVICCLASTAFLVLGLM